MDFPYLPHTIESERQRLADLEVEIAKRQAALHDRRLRLKDEAASVLQLEASLIELGQENESNLRLLNVKEIQLEERLLAIGRQEEALLNAGHRVEDEFREAADCQTNITLSLEDRWRAMEEAARMNEDQFTMEASRLRKQHAELEDRENMLRDKQREHTHREQAIASWQRRLQTKQLLLNDLSRNAIDRLVSELQERESVLQMD